MSGEDSNVPCCRVHSLKRSGRGWRQFYSPRDAMPLWRIQFRVSQRRWISTISQKCFDDLHLVLKPIVGQSERQRRLRPHLVIWPRLPALQHLADLRNVITCDSKKQIKFGGRYSMQGRRRGGRPVPYRRRVRSCRQCVPDGVMRDIRSKFVLFILFEAMGRLGQPA